MEAIIAIVLGIWVIMSGMICYFYMIHDADREKNN